MTFGNIWAGSVDANAGLRGITKLNGIGFVSEICLCFLLCRNKFVEFDMKPVCKKCYERFPLELKKRLKKLAESLGHK